MQGTLFSVNVLRSPFGVRGAHLVPPPDAEVAVGKVSTVTDAKVTDSYAQVLPLHTPVGRTTRQSYAVSGTRGIQQLVANTRSASFLAPSTLVAAQRVNSRGHCMPSATPQLQVISKHEKGRLLVWNGLTGAVVAACIFPPTFNVDHCAVAASYVYTTVEGSAVKSVAEEEACVYVWSRSTLRSVTVLRGHSGRLTALGVWPMETSTLIATASLDGTVLLWRHQHSPGPWDGAVANEDPVQLLWVLATAELGSVHSLKFLAADTVVAAATRCALAFVRFPEAPAKRKCRGSMVSMGKADALAFQMVRSIVDPNGGTTFLHVCPYNRTSGGVVAVTPALGNFSLSSLASSSSARVSAAAPVSESSTVYLLTGSTSGYMQEWTVDVENTASAEAPPKPAASSAEPVYVDIKCRWHHKAHSATVDCVVTDEDVVVSTSLFDRASIYHRTSGATCAIASTAAIPVLVPQLKELVWGTIDGTLSVASYARFASGVENELQLLWTARPHATAIRGVCLSLTPDLRWDTLCTGAADGSMCVWRAMPESGRTAAGSTAAKKEGAAPLIAHLLHVLALPPNTVEKGDADGKRVAAVVAGLKASTAGTQGAIIVVELAATGDVGQVSAVLLKDNVEVSCAHLCRGDKGTLSLWVGTRCGQLLHALHKPAQKVWTALMPVQWDSKPNGSVVAIADDAGSSSIMVAVAEAPDASRASQRLFLSALQLEPGATVKTMLSRWESDIALPCTVYAASHRERTFAMTWVSKVLSGEQASPRAISGLLVCCSDGTMVRCLRTSMADAAPSVGPWSTPEVLVMAAASGQANTIQRNFDESPSFSATAVASPSRNSDLLCVDMFENSKRLLMPSKVRTTQLTAILCDVGTERVRLAAVRQEKPDAASEVALFDNAGREFGRVTHDGAVLHSNDVSAASASKGPISYTPKVQGASLRRSSAAAVATAAEAANCTAIAAHAGDRIAFIGYDDGLLQMVDTADVYVFCRRWATDATGVARRIVDVRYAGSGVVVVLLANHHLCSFAVPPRSLLDQPSL
ncbi:conserved hypothetical protein [Leishmania infantum JPCM5]|uniref:WD_domain_-_G-beta_repeat_-_putative n=2 Tax=Leishmania infantum TaxID=5671 RepID=A0A6L0XIZ0_LEIIN|nr:conserved hypothetical protein [Leishmania infantum JPCM5]CAC9499241.1 WD_domain_-_G-beta_repeat_-_putative [Leishmania infantum]CAM69035.1 conserved hypothetical protein [Leishmania infantum JPCM5]SUZ42969.1 WD_domain_-_G-beta_repeat_-_putative [Leishmania infantum]|eukprot:XP_001466323.1 conserved hypothetical protein [Leishmania infantum JPCM5]